jgi:hypothetical protein
MYLFSFLNKRKTRLKRYAVTENEFSNTLVQFIECCNVPYITLITWNFETPYKLFFIYTRISINIPETVQDCALPLLENIST